ncbi:MAG: hypothetical protein GY787_04455, partial [Alteromonadales bacterium]|nr:hypothetical protein [Alteromonadales bacterium]
MEAINITGKRQDLTLITKGYYKDFQANSIRCRRALSFFYLGKEIIGRESYSFNVKDVALALGGLKAKAEAEFY